MKPSFLVFQNGKQISHEVLLESLMASPGKLWRNAPEIFDFGIFESLKGCGEKICFETEHLKRLAQSARTCGFSLPLDAANIHNEIHKALQSFFQANKVGHRESVFVRLSIWGRHLFVMIGKRGRKAELYRKGVRLQTSPVPKTHTNASTAEVKTSAYLNSITAFMEPSAPGIDEKILLDSNGYVTESCVGNLFAVKGGKLYSPEPQGILNGVTRRFVIKCAHQAGIKTSEMPLTRHDFFNADEVFLTNTSWEILPAAELDGRTIGDGIPGPVTSKLQRIFKPYAKERYL